MFYLVFCFSDRSLLSKIIISYNNEDRIVCIVTLHYIVHYHYSDSFNQERNPRKKLLMSIIAVIIIFSITILLENFNIIYWDFSIIYNI